MVIVTVGATRLHQLTTVSTQFYRVALPNAKSPTSSRSRGSVHLIYLKSAIYYLGARLSITVSSICFFKYVLILCFRVGGACSEGTYRAFSRTHLAWLVLPLV